MVRDIKFSDKREQGILGSPSPEEIKERNLDPDAIYILNEYRYLKTRIREDQSLDPEMKRRLISYIKMTHSPKLHAMLSHETLHKVLSDIGEEEASTDLDKLSGYVETLERSGLASEDAINKAMRRFYGKRPGKDLMYGRLS